MKKFIGAVGLILAIIILVFALRLTFNRPPNTPLDLSVGADLIRVSLPFPEAVVGKKFSVIGEARGFWFFEASFPVVVVDQNGATLAAGTAKAEPDPKTGELNWMTENFVPFRADLKIPESYIGPATLILKKDNPSGLPENDAFISIPINIEY